MDQSGIEFFLIENLLILVQVQYPVSSKLECHISF